MDWHSYGMKVVALHAVPQHHPLGGLFNTDLMFIIVPGEQKSEWRSWFVHSPDRVSRACWSERTVA